MKDKQDIYNELIKDNEEDILNIQNIYNELLKLNKANISDDLKLHIILTRYLNRIFKIIPWIKWTFYEKSKDYDGFTYFKLIDINTTYNDIFINIISLLDYNIHINMKFNEGINNFIKND